MSFQIAWRSVTNKPINEDRVLVLPLDDLTILMVADGVGGRAGGARAADVCAQVVRRHAPEVKNARDGSEWAALLTLADEAIEADAEAGETTGVVVAAGAGWVCGASVGDSEAWLLGDNVEVLTRGRGHKPFLGYGGAFPRPFQAPWKGVLLIASDGLTKYAAPETIARIVSENEELEAAADALVQAVRYPSGTWPDDVSLVLCRDQARESGETADATDGASKPGWLRRWRGSSMLRFGAASVR